MAEKIIRSEGLNQGEDLYLKWCSYVVPHAEGKHGGLPPGCSLEEFEASVARLLADEPVESEVKEGRDTKTES